MTIGTVRDHTNKLLDSKTVNISSVLVILGLVYMKKNNKNNKNNKIFTFIKEMGFMVILIFLTVLLLITNEISSTFQNNNLLIVIFTYIASMFIMHTDFVPPALPVPTVPTVPATPPVDLAPPNTEIPA